MSQLPTFKNEALLRQALTHRSYCNERPDENALDNQRLEFVGDAVLGFIIGVFLYQIYPGLPEGELTRHRSTLVDQKRLAQLAQDLQIGSLMRIGRGVEREGGRNNPSLLSDTLEAVIGAYFLDAGIEAVRVYVETLFAPLAHSLGAENGATIDAKSRFQQWALAHLGPQNPRYRIIETSGPDHAKMFTAQVLVGDVEYGIGRDRSKREAEKRAAECALQRLGF